jgi:hypothetical protein
MNIRMNYIKDGETKEVTCVGFAKNNGWATRDYFECIDDTTGHFVASIKDLEFCEKSAADVMLAGKEFDELSNVISVIVNKK